MKGHLFDIDRELAELAAEKLYLRNTLGIRLWNFEDTRRQLQQHYSHIVLANSR